MLRGQFPLPRFQYSKDTGSGRFFFLLVGPTLRTRPTSEGFSD